MSFFIDIVHGFAFGILHEDFENGCYAVSVFIGPIQLLWFYEK